MRCPTCGQENRSGARFCGRCGSPLEAPPAQQPAAEACPVCGSPIKPGARFCTRCGSTLSEAPQAAAAPPVQGPAPVRSSQPERQIPEYRNGRPGVGFDAVPEIAQPSTGYESAGTRSRKRPLWLLGVATALLTAGFFCCVVVGLAAAPAFSGVVPSQPEVDPTAEDITIRVAEAYISTMLGGALPPSVDGEAALDVQPGNTLVTTIDFQLLIVRLQVLVNATISVEDGRIRVEVDNIETGGQNLLELVGVEQFALGDAITDAIQQGLEEELGEGARLLTITTDDEYVILTARWE